MKHLATYMIEAVVCSGILQAFYALALERLPKFRWSRSYLLVSMLLAAGIPLLRIPVWPGEVITLPTPEPAPVTAVEPVAVAEVPQGIDTEMLLMAAWIAGSALLLGFMARQMLRIRRMRRNARILRTESLSVVRVHRRIAAFSFLRSIYIWDQTPQGDMKAILRHEASHIAHRHSLERIAMEMMKAAMWWNPFAWVAARKLVEVEEFEADNDVLTSGYAKARYMEVLFRQLFGYSPEIANGVRDSLTKKRFKMMTSHTQGRYALLRLAGVIPVTAALLCAFSLTSRAAQVRFETPKAIPNPDIRTAPSDSPNGQPVQTELQIFLAGKDKRLFSSESHAQGAIVRRVGSDSGTIADAEGKASIEAPEGSVVEIIYPEYETTAFIASGNQPKRIVILYPEGPDNPQMPISSRDQYGVKQTPLYVIDGMERRENIELVANEIEAVRILKGKEAVEKYGKRGEYGVVEITSARSAETDDQEAPEERPLLIAERMPLFQGGDLVKFREWIQTRLHYPAEARKQGIQGRVVLTFVVERDGSISETSVLQSQHRLLSEEALRIVKSSSGLWTPAEQKGSKVRLKYTLPVDFRIAGNSPGSPGRQEAGSNPESPGKGATEPSATTIDPIVAVSFGE